MRSFDNISQILNEPQFDKAFKTAELAAMSEKERHEYEQSKLVYSELKSAIDTSKEEGIKQVAKEMKNNGIDFNLISKCTGLSNDEIEKL